MKTFLFMTAAAGVLVVSGVVEAQPGPRGGQGEGGPGRGGAAIMMLGAADLNGDNAVTRAEVEQLRRDEFAWRDRNGDGFLDRDDLSPTAQRMSELRGGDGERPRRGRGGRRGPAQLDTNDDQRISLDEFVDREGRLFERLDTNGDGVISASELDAAVEARQSRRDARFWWRD